MTELFRIGDRVAVRLSFADRWRSGVVVGRSFDQLVVSARGLRVGVPRRLIHRLVRPMSVVATARQEQPA